ncbi:helix-turn-helix domain-containing protein [Dongia deserti]|uniref:helix-turn-helix domain-containing protein n=1 Tax=Dongia deserti TaxID=2268030 RepID=UPI0013C423EF|nr:helix-turn-helix transcriptional regulator [Dongia deserti]
MAQNQKDEETLTLEGHSDLGVRAGKRDSDGIAARLGLALGSDSPFSLARRTGIRDSLIRKYLKGSEPGLTNGRKIADALGVSLGWLSGGEPEIARDYELEIQAWQSTLESLKGLEGEPSMEDINALIRVLRQGLQARQEVEQIENRLREKMPEHYGASGDQRNVTLGNRSDARAVPQPPLDRSVLREALQRFFRAWLKMSEEDAADNAAAFVGLYEEWLRRRG